MPRQNRCNLSRPRVYNLAEGKSMNWNKLIVMSNLALALAAPAALAQRGHRGGAAARGVMPHIAPSSGRTFQAPAGHGSGRLNAARGGSFRTGNGRGNHWQHADHGRWGHRGWHHHHHHHRHHFYPYYPYGYPYWGTSFYFGNNRPQYASGSGSLIVEVQQELARAGYYRGAIDGILGSGTRRAISLYERANGLPPDGRIDADLLAAMGVG